VTLSVLVLATGLKHKKALYVSVKMILRYIKSAKAILLTKSKHEHAQNSHDKIFK
jgi:hypothetical protein